MQCFTYSYYYYYYYYYYSLPTYHIVATLASGCCEVGSSCGRLDPQYCMCVLADTHDLALCTSPRVLRVDRGGVVGCGGGGGWSAGCGRDRDRGRGRVCGCVCSLCTGWLVLSESSSPDQSLKSYH